MTVRGEEKVNTILPTNNTKDRTRIPITTYLEVCLSSLCIGIYYYIEREESIDRNNVYYVRITLWISQYFINDGIAFCSIARNDACLLDICKSPNIFRPVSEKMPYVPFR